MISDIRLQHFRSYTDAIYEFGEGVNIIVGPNGSGKTNLMEAILVLARGVSYRAADLELISFDQEWSRLDARTDISGERVLKLRRDLLNHKTFEINNKTFHRLNQTQIIPTVLFEPNHLLILQGAPDSRRNYIDEVLEQIIPGFTSFRKNYRRVLAQRNALLKRPGAEQSDFFPWDLRLSELGAVIHRYRYELISAYNKEIGGIYQELSGRKTRVKLDYISRYEAANYETQLLQALELGRTKDIARGYTGYGPHREDWIVMFDDKSAQTMASRGEIRTTTLALKILELQRLHLATNQQPILLLDDVFSELDGSRRRALTAYLQRYQTFLTTTDADIVVKHFTSSTIIPLSSPH